MIALILGSGLSKSVDHFEIQRELPYNQLFHIPYDVLDGHERMLYEVKHGKQNLVILSGKLHAYEGYDYDELIAPLEYVDKHYNIDQWIVTSASGGLSKEVKVGEWHEIKDIITLDSLNGLTGIKPKVNRSQQGFNYAFQKGPSLGTVAEYKMLSILNADMVGMSMLPEAIYLESINANYSMYSLPVCTYDPISYSITEPDHQEVIAVADRSITKLLSIIIDNINRKL